MNRKQCEHCDDEVLIPERDEYINPDANSESRLEHLDRTGHDIHKPPEPPERHDEDD